MIIKYLKVSEYSKKKLQLLYGIYKYIRVYSENWNILVSEGKKSKNDFLSSGERNEIKSKFFCNRYIYYKKKLREFLYNILKVG